MDAREKALLIERADELSDLADLLRELEVPVRTTRGPLPHPEALEGVQLVVVSAPRLLEPGLPDLRSWPRTIAVVDDASRTLTAHLRRIGVGLVVRRPIHPRALRLLLLRETYRGPERRRRRRTLIGLPVRIGPGLFKQRGTLLELSNTGARVEMKRLPKLGSELRLVLGREVTGGRSLDLRARVGRCGRPRSQNGRGEVGLELLDSRVQARSIEALLDRFALGPASCGVARARDPGRSVPASGASAMPPVELPRTPLPTPEEATVEPAVDTGPSLAPTGSATDDRRRDQRVAYERRIVALGEEAARVLIGRDLSIGGMRIAPCDAVRVGDVLRVALHCGSDHEPLVVVADALRDDGDAGLVVAFRELGESSRARLEAFIRGHASIHGEEDPDRHDDSTETSPLVVGEVLSAGIPDAAS